MNTTSLVAEIIVVGFFASIWLVALVIRPLVPEMNHTLDVLANHKEYAPLVTIVLLICWYQLGWLMNSLCGPMMDLVKFNRVKDNQSIGVPGGYRGMSTVVYQSANTALLHDLYIDRRVMRIARAGIVNFALIAVSIIVLEGLNSWLSVLFFGLSVACVLQAIQRSSRYYKQIYDAYCRLELKEERNKQQFVSQPAVF